MHMGPRARAVAMIMMVMVFLAVAMPVMIVGRHPGGQA